jgi:hypothetical protein
MNCDQVFQHLTSVRPTPQNGALTKHLKHCRSCRQMAELFEPAVQLLGPESDEAQAIPDQTCDRWSRVWVSAGVAERVAAQLEQCTEQRAGHWRSSPALLRSAAVLLAGIVLGILCTQANVTPRAEQPHSAAVVSDLNESHEPKCRYENLIAEHMQSDPVQFCVNCRPKLAAEIANIVTVCMVCHTRPSIDHAPSGSEPRPVF